MDRAYSYKSQKQKKFLIFDGENRKKFMFTLLPD